MKRTTYLWLLLLACLPIELFSQQVEVGAIDVSVFEQRAQEDAKMEQILQFSSVDDELDYWTDQLDFEKTLKKTSYKGYLTYIRSKKAAYVLHEITCNELCRHGELYYRQALFYSNNTPKATTTSIVVEMKN